jgi:hypothetical protein
MWWWVTVVFAAELGQGLAGQICYSLLVSCSDVRF